MLGSLTVPPQKPLIVDDRGRQVEGEVGIGPFREGESLSLECNVPGGKCSGLHNGAKTFILHTPGPTKCDFAIQFTVAQGS